MFSFNVFLIHHQKKMIPKKYKIITHLNHIVYQLHLPAMVFLKNQGKSTARIKLSQIVYLILASSFVARLNPRFHQNAESPVSDLVLSYNN